MASKRPSRHAPLLIHPGYHKTGTTWYQRKLFLPEFGYRQLLDHDEVFAALIRPHGLTFEAAPARELIDSRRSPADSGMIDVISSEILSGTPYYGARESDMYARRLKEVAPEARILITIREQMRMLAAIYMQYISRALTIKPAEFFANDPIAGYFAFAPEHFEYHRLVKLYQDLYGAENVLVVTQEALAKDGLSVARQIAEFAGVSLPWDPAKISLEPESPSPPESFAPLLRRINHFRSGPTGLGPMIDLGPVSAFAYRATAALGRTKPVKNALRNVRPVSREVLRRYRGYYRDSNRKLLELMGGRLELPGYEV